MFHVEQDGVVESMLWEKRSGNVPCGTLRWASQALRSTWNE